MLSPETIAEYRRMTPGQRLELALQMTDENLPYLVQGRPEVVERRFELLRRENDLRNHNMRVAMARTRSDP
ncbi:MAG: hypothetical protein O3C39_02695 [Planctomycetota bacterium]|jgi:hypothetical protein|nr:hypothetical protein [Pirellulales bacterium]MDA0254927.1 hypothetical protein [Planctomycetota bacterium]MDA1200570.1 hypothetical protein [Planctomycetota bacterium]